MSPIPISGILHYQMTVSPIPISGILHYQMTVSAPYQYQTSYTTRWQWVPHTNIRHPTLTGDCLPYQYQTSCTDWWLCQISYTIWWLCLPCLYHTSHTTYTNITISGNVPSQSYTFVSPKHFFFILHPVLLNSLLKIFLKCQIFLP